MNGSQDPSYDLEELQGILAKAGLITRDAVLDLVLYPPAFARRIAYRKAHYLVRSNQEAVCHLVVGKNLAPLHVRARDFSAACPKLACRPLLYHEGKSVHYLCLEHFSGEPLDIAVESGRCSASAWLEITRRALELLAGTAQPSDALRLQSEITTLLQDACAFPGFSDVDVNLLIALTEPILLEAGADVPLVERWSTGDFVGRNLLVNAEGDYRLIDYDHATRTHFGGVDWIRLMQFSVLPPGVSSASIAPQFPHRSADEVYLWLHQLSLLREAEPTEETRQHTASTIQNLFATVRRASAGKAVRRQARSFLIGSLVDQQAETASTLEKRTAWAKSLETDLEQARVALTAQTQLFAERTAWAKSLERELHATRQDFEKLTDEFAERTTWAKSLEAEVARARGELANLRRDVAAEHAAFNTATASTLRAQLESEIAESEARRLAMALADAQLHVEGLLQHAAKLQNSINLLQSTNQESEAALREKEHLLRSSIADLQATRAELSRYEGRLLCRLAARPSPLQSATKSQP